MVGKVFSKIMANHFFKKTVRTVLSVDGTDYPVKIFFEYRNGWRASFGKKNINFRIPLGIPKKTQFEYLQKAKEWAIYQIKKNPTIKVRYTGKEYADGDALFVGDRRYLLNIQLEDRKISSANLNDSVINMRISNLLSKAQQEDVKKNLISKIVAQDFFPSFLKRVLDLNNKHFRQPIADIKLRYTVSKWGSCSSSKKLSFSTRLLLLPQDIIDYVIIHELAHLIEQNHSHRFWALVETAIPNYKEKEKWLKQKGKEFDF